jgi:hypothetical protein
MVGFISPDNGEVVVSGFFTSKCHPVPVLAGSLLLTVKIQLLGAHPEMLFTNAS